LAATVQKTASSAGSALGPSAHHEFDLDHGVVGTRAAVDLRRYAIDAVLADCRLSLADRCSGDLAGHDAGATLDLAPDVDGTALRAAQRGNGGGVEHNHELRLVTANHGVHGRILLRFSSLVKTRRSCVYSAV
jgi:hypothetical protein